MGFKLLFFFALLLIVEVYAYQAFKTLLRGKWMLIGYVIISILLFIYIAYSLMSFDRSVGQTKQTMFTMGLMLLVFVPKIILALVLFGEDMYRLISGMFRAAVGDSSEEFLTARRTFVSQIGLGLAAIPFFSLIYGMTIGKYNFKVIRQTIHFPDLPEEFDGFRITQISDVHSGSFDDPEKISYAIDLINEQNSDMILFTGDIVNTHAKEMHPWLETFKRIHKPAYGKYSVLGNHDYGEYVDWKTQKEKDDNFEAIKSLYGEIDFELLLNENRFIEKNGQRIALIGVENWGHNFKKVGDINKASKGVAQEDFKIVMSHDPSHWDYELKRDPKNYHLTLAGHTHGMQFGIEIPGYFKWSLAQYIYPQWAGLYETLGCYVYVNRGFGFHAYPGRVGIMPEITVIELKKGEKVS
ncbi:metallophosphoesterase [Flavobacterium algicola]|uniref:metallophosphoesterase n=1 Tax=Flavobacterium algicola TaxID=556529 RepID=UPI001EFD476C|nr:metallophosphoesterase [Flavobacterium algicola]MCG9791545.1 metallophosphoesterase [Flavobacterium algicola]